MKKLLISIVILLILTVGYVVYKFLSPDIGTVVVNSYPSGAGVYLDGELKGETPLTLKNVSFGTYAITIKLNGYKDYKEVISINRNNRNVTLSAILEHAVFTIHVNSIPEGANVYLDGVLKGVTPATINDIIANSKHLLEIKLDNYETYKQLISGKENDVFEIMEPLTPIATHLIVSSIPEGATVYLNDKVIGKTPLDTKNINPGSFTLKISYPQYIPYTEEITIEKGKTVRRDIVLLKSETYLSLDSNPEGARVSIDGLVVGTTPYETISITIGKHKIRIEQDGYLPYETEIEIRKGKPEKININLLKLP